MKLKLFAFAFLFNLVSTYAQHFQLSPEAKISVLTIGPGESLNDAFGHNGFRITDPNLKIDIVYGYGEYDFDAPNFYLKFAQGKLNYLISRHNFSDFYKHYVLNNRSIKEQELNLSSAENQKLFDALENNYKPENRGYLYDFFYDNCATRIRDVTVKATASKINFNLPDAFQLKTFRTLIHDHVGLNTWGSFGIDIALGSVIERKASAYEHLFLPEYIHKFFGEATFNNAEPLITTATTLYEKKDGNSTFNFLFSPFVITALIAFLVLYLTYTDHKHNKRNKQLDLILFGSTGLIGVLILLLWFATDHSATAQNYNLLWALPLNIILITQLIKPKVKNWVKSYMKFLVIMLCLMTLHWIIGVQTFALPLIPILIALVVRYIYLIRFLNQK